MNVATVVLASTIWIGGWFVIDRRILDVIDRLDGVVPRAPQGIVAATHGELPRYAGDTIYYSIDLHDSAPVVIEKIDTFAKRIVYHVDDPSIEEFCVGSTEECLYQPTLSEFNTLETFITDRLTSVHAACLSSASSYLRIERVLLEPLMRGTVVVQLGDGRFARMRELPGKVRFDSVVVYDNGDFDSSDVELFTVYKNRVKESSDIHVLKFDMRSETRTINGEKIVYSSGTYRKNSDTTYVRVDVHRREDALHDVMFTSISAQIQLIVRGQVVAGGYTRSEHPCSAPYPKSEAEILGLVK